MAKGSSFERMICKQFSLWWSGGQRDDIFWRSCQSGGRATERAKKGKTTFGSYGDITAVDPIGGPLIKAFTIELKRGRSHGNPWELVDSVKSKVVRPFEKALNQAIASHQAAGSVAWMLICRPDRKVAMIYLPWGIHKLLGSTSPFLHPPTTRFDLRVNRDGSASDRVRFVGMPLDAFLLRITPAQLLKGLEQPPHFRK